MSKYNFSLKLKPFIPTSCKLAGAIALNLAILDGKTIEGYGSLITYDMNIKQLKEELDKLGIRPTEYSLEGDLNTDRVILYRSYEKWIVFYIDEKGFRRNEKTFYSESAACNHIYDTFSDMAKMRNAPRNPH